MTKAAGRKRKGKNAQLASDFMRHLTCICVAAMQAVHLPELLREAVERLGQLVHVKAEGLERGVNLGLDNCMTGRPSRVRVDMQVSLDHICAMAVV